MRPIVLSLALTGCVATPQEADSGPAGLPDVGDIRSLTDSSAAADAAPETLDGSPFFAWSSVGWLCSDGLWYLFLRGGWGRGPSCAYDIDRAESIGLALHVGPDFRGGTLQLAADDGYHQLQGAFSPLERGELEIELERDLNDRGISPASGELGAHGRLDLSFRDGSSFSGAFDALACRPFTMDDDCACSSPGD